MNEKNLKLSEVVDYINELENRLDNLIDYTNDLEDKLNNAEKIIDKIDEIVFKTGSLEEKEWEKIQNKYKNIEMSNLAIETLNKIIYELWELRYENDTVSDYIKEVCYETVEKFQDCLDDLLLDEKTIEFDK